MTRCQPCTSSVFGGFDSRAARVSPKYRDASPGAVWSNNESRLLILNLDGSSELTCTDEFGRPHVSS